MEEDCREKKESEKRGMWNGGGGGEGVEGRRRREEGSGEKGGRRRDAQVSLLRLTVTQKFYANKK